MLFHKRGLLTLRIPQHGGSGYSVFPYMTAVSVISSISLGLKSEFSTPKWFIFSPNNVVNLLTGKLCCSIVFSEKSIPPPWMVIGISEREGLKMQCC